MIGLAFLIWCWLLIGFAGFFLFVENIYGAGVCAIVACVELSIFVHMNRGKQYEDTN